MKKFYTHHLDYDKKILGAVSTPADIEEIKIIAYAHHTLQGLENPGTYETNANSLEGKILNLLDIYDAARTRGTDVNHEMAVSIIKDRMRNAAKNSNMPEEDFRRDYDKIINVLNDVKTNFDEFYAEIS